MAEDTSKESESEENSERHFSQGQYDMLKRCSDKKDLTEWNEWRRRNPKIEIFLEGADLKNAYLVEANLVGARLCPLYGEWQRGEADFRECNEGKFANLENTKLKKAKLQKSILNGANLNKSDMTDTCLQRATLVYAKLKNAYLLRTNLQDSVLEGAYLAGADISRCDLCNANFRTAKLDSSTSIWKPVVNKCRKGYTNISSNRASYKGEREYTDFQGVALDSVSIDPSTKQLLEYNIRRINWEQWYKFKNWQGDCTKEDERHIVTQKLMFFVRIFWLISDYGLSIGKIIATFVGLAFFFAIVYWLCPNFVTVNCEVGNIRGFWHALYFSVVTMTTLGFGDIAANPDSWVGQTLLMLQVIWGYVLLGALVTRFAVLFMAGGPAGTFKDK